MISELMGHSNDSITAGMVQDEVPDYVLLEVVAQIDYYF